MRRWVVLDHIGVQAGVRSRRCGWWAGVRWKARDRGCGDGLVGSSATESWWSVCCRVCRRVRCAWRIGGFYGFGRFRMAREKGAQLLWRVSSSETPDGVMLEAYGLLLTPYPAG